MDNINDLTKPISFCKRLEDKMLQCFSCAFECSLRPGDTGVCRMRFNKDGILYGPWGYVAGAACDPVEKKPFYHLMPGRTAFSFGMLGCNFRCEFCQNWRTSQVNRDPAAEDVSVEVCKPEQLVAAVVRNNSSILASTYNEPLITADWAFDIFKLSKAEGIKNVFVSNGFASKEVLEKMDPVLDAMNVDLKCFSDEGYRKLGGRLQPVLDTIRRLYDSGKLVEVVTLLVPGFSDDREQIEKCAEFLASVSTDIPWHLTAWHSDYKQDRGFPRTSSERLSNACAIGKEVGLKYVYAGNVSGMGKLENTYCSSCDALLVERSGFMVKNLFVRNGSCPECGTAVYGIW